MVSVKRSNAHERKGVAVNGLKKRWPTLALNHVNVLGMLAIVSFVILSLSYYVVEKTSTENQEGRLKGTVNHISSGRTFSNVETMTTTNDTEASYAFIRNRNQADINLALLGIDVVPNSEDVHSSEKDRKVIKVPKNIGDNDDTLSDTSSGKKNYNDTYPLHIKKSMDIYNVSMYSTPTHMNGNGVRKPRNDHDINDASISNSTPLREQFFSRSLKVKELVMKEHKESSIKTPTLDQNVAHLRPFQQKTEYSNLACSQQDAFQGIPVDGAGKVPDRGWIPPQGSSIESIKKWENEYASVMQKIKSATMGGGELRAFAKSQVHNLKRFRHELFCHSN